MLNTKILLNISQDALWHAKYKDSTYVFVGCIPFDLTEGDLMAAFAQYVSFHAFSINIVEINFDAMSSM